MMTRVLILGLVVLGLGVAAAWWLESANDASPELSPGPDAEESAKVETAIAKASPEPVEVMAPTPAPESPASVPDATASTESPKTGKIQGMVRDEEGAFVPGVVLHAVVPPAPPGGVDLPFELVVPLTTLPELDDPNHRGVSDAVGRYEIAGLAEGKYILVARGEGYRQRIIPGIEVRHGSATQTDVQLAAGLAIEGIVLNPDGMPVAGAEVSAGGGMISLGNGMRFTTRIGGPSGESVGDTKTTTDAAGRFRLDGLSSGNQSLTARHADWAPGEIGDVAAGSRDVQITLKKGVTIAGVVRGPDGGPVPGAEVMTPAFPTPWTVTGETDSAGRFQLEKVSPGHVQLVVRAEGYPSKSVPGLEVEDGGHATDLEIVLDAGASVTGRVLGPDGAPLAGAQVGVGSTQGPMFFFRHETTTNEEGLFTVAGLKQDRSYRGRVSHAQYLETKIDDFDTRSGTVDLGDFTVRAGGTVTGRILDEEGNPVAAATVGLSDSDVPSSGGGIRRRVAMVRMGDDGPTMIASPSLSATTKEDGYFEISPVKGGEYALEVSAKGFSPHTSDRFLVDEGSEKGGFEIRLATGLAITGHVRDTSGQPIVGARVEASRHTPTEAHARATTDGEGSFSIDGLEASGNYDVVATFGQFAPAQVEGTPGGPALDLVLEPRGGVSGVVIDKATREPVEEFGVKLRQPPGAGPGGFGNLSAHGFGPGTQFKDPNGRFILTDVNPGIYTLEVKAEGYAAFELKDLDVPPGEHIELDLALDVGGAVEGYVVDRKGDPIEGAEIYRVQERRGPQAVMVRMAVTVDDEDGVVSTVNLGDEERVTTDEKGYFLLSGLPEGQVTLAVDHRGFINRKVEEVDVVRAQTRSIDRVKMEKGGTVHGVVYDETGAVFSRGSLLLFSLDDEGERGRPTFLTLQKDGGFSKSGLPSGSYELKVQRWGGEGGMHMSLGRGDPDAAFALKVDEERRVEIHLKP